MKKAVFWVIVLFISFNSFGQTDLELIDEYKNLKEWQTPKLKIDSILNASFIGGHKKFIEIIYKNVKFDASHQDNWVQNYLVEIECENNKLNVKFRNNPLQSDRIFISNALDKTIPFWVNEKSIKFNLLFSSGIGRTFNTHISKAYIQLNTYRMVSLSSCNMDDQCLFEDKERLHNRVGNLLELNELEGAIYYLKILARRFPFDKEINAKLLKLRINYSGN